MRSPDMTEGRSLIGYRAMEETIEMKFTNSVQNKERFPTFDRRKCGGFWFGALIFGFAAIAATNMAGQHAETTESQVVDNAGAAKEIQIQGRVVCLAEAMHNLYRADLPANHAHLYGFETTEGVFYTLLRTDLSEALFADERLHQKTLIITGRTFPKTHLLEAIRLQSLHDGVVHDLYYYCDTCAIRAAAPGDCVCCQAPLELVEKP